MDARWWVKIALYALPLLALLSACAIQAPPSTPVPTAIPTLLAANSETRVDISPGSAARLYNFSATRLKIDSRTPGFAFSAEIRNAAGKTVAAFANSLQNVQLTLEPQNGLYEISVLGANPQQAGTVSLALGSAVIAPAVLDGTAYRAPDCRVTNSSGVNTIIRSAPATNYAVLALFPPGASLPAIGRTDNGWLTVSFEERQGWIDSNVSGLMGDCDALPVLRNPAIPNAPADAQAYLLQADRDGSGVFRESISAPDGDLSDLIWVQVNNLDSAAPNNYREFALTLDCAGSERGTLRWGSPNSPSLRCGESVVLPFLQTNNQHPIIVVFPAGSPQSYVEYSLSLLPADAVG
jgi:hypothetical protein